MSLISVVVPVYKVERYLEQCLDSILIQEHSDIEVLCVDDCSPDRSAEIIQDYALKDERIRLLTHEKNQGLGPARNTGIQAAKGETIGFVDSDDWIEPEMFRVLNDVMLAEAADIVQCSAARISDGRNIGSYPISSGTRDAHIMHSMFGEGPKFVGAAWNKIYKTKLFRENNIYYPAILFEDVATTPRLLHRAKKVASVRESYLNYRFRDDSIVNSVEVSTLLKRVDGLFSAANILAKYFVLRKAHSLEFILNFRRFFFPQVERNIRMAEKLGSLELEECFVAIERNLGAAQPCVSYFFPNTDESIKKLKNSIAH